MEKSRSTGSEFSFSFHSSSSAPQRKRRCRFQRFPSWAFNIPTRCSPNVRRPARSTCRAAARSTMPRSASSANPPDWFPTNTPCARCEGKPVALQACAPATSCRTGIPNPPISLPPVEYFVRQMNYFKSGAEKRHAHGPIAKPRPKKTRAGGGVFAGIKP